VTDISFKFWLASLSYSARHPFVRTGLLANAVLAVVLLMVTAVVWWPAQREQTTLIDQIDIKRRAVVEAVRAADIVRAYESAARSIDMVEKKLNASASQADLVRHLARIAGKRQVRIVSESYSEAKAPTEYQSLFLDLSVEGRYIAFRDFLLDIPTLPTWIEVQDARIERARDASGSIKAQIRLMTYRSGSRSGSGKGEKS